jgi:hypothetical protein
MSGWVFTPVDIYCERVAPGLLAEPLNAASNIGFFIAAFILYYMHTFLRRVHALKNGEALVGVAGFLCFSMLMHVLVQVFAPTAVSLYLASLLLLWAFALNLLRRRHAQARRMLAAALLFTFSLSLRTLDVPYCESWPLGTHFLWHLLNAAVLYTLVSIFLPKNKTARHSTE